MGKGSSDPYVKVLAGNRRSIGTVLRSTAFARCDETRQRQIILEWKAATAAEDPAPSVEPPAPKPITKSPAPRKGGRAGWGGLGRAWAPRTRQDAARPRSGE